MQTMEMSENPREKDASSCLCCHSYCFIAPYGPGQCPLVTKGVSGVVSLACCFLLCCTLGISYTFGNINPYITSYLRNSTGGSDVDYTDTLWISQALTISTNVVMPFVGLLAHRINLKLYILIGILFHAGSMFGTYWAIQQSLAMVVVTYGLVQGVAHAMVYPSAILVAIGWFPGRQGFICGIVLMGYGLGSLAWNELTTRFINRENLQPDLRVEEDVYYTQKEVLRYVPDCFLLLGIVMVSMQLLCLALLCKPLRAGQVISTYISSSKDTISKRKLLNASTEVTETSFLIKETTADSLKDDSRKPLFKGHESNRSGAQGQVVDRQEDQGRSQDSSRSESHQYHPKDLVKSRVFWTLWFMTSFSTVGTSFISSLFKAYGQTFITDDYFLATVAAVSSIFNAAGRPFWGLLADKIGYRMVALLAQCVLAVFMVTFIACEYMGQVAFLVWVCTMFLSMCGFFTMVPALTFALFGSRHFNANVGLWDTHAVVGSILTGLVAPGLKNAFGWHGMFFVGFAGMFISVLLNMSISIDCAGTIPQHMQGVLSLRR